MANKYVKFIIGLVLTGLLAACSSASKYVLPTHRFVGAVIVSNDVNPNAAGRPSPITLYFYQLQGADTFMSADFFTLYNNPQQTLAADFVDMGKLDLAPGSHTEVNFALDDKTKYVGVVAAYQQLPRSVWRAVVPMNGWGKERVYVRVGALTLSLSKVDGSDANTSSIDLGSLADKAKSAASNAQSLSGNASGAASSGSSGVADSSSASSGSSWTDKLSSASSALSNSSSNAASGGSSASSAPASGSSSTSSDSSGGGYMQKYNDIKSVFKGGGS